MSLGAQDLSGDVSMLKATVYGTEHQVGLVTKVDTVEKSQLSIDAQVKGAITTLKWVGSLAIGAITILAAAVEIYRALKP